MDNDIAKDAEFTVRSTPRTVVVIGSCVLQDFGEVKFFELSSNKESFRHQIRHHRNCGPAVEKRLVDEVQ
eukprot:scaffold2177_cov115-Cylindrotheca_fusiformis.AAC.3